MALHLHVVVYGCNSALTLKLLDRLQEIFMGLLYFLKYVSKFRICLHTYGGNEEMHIPLLNAVWSPPQLYRAKM